MRISLEFSRISNICYMVPVRFLEGFLKGLLERISIMTQNRLERIMKDFYEDIKLVFQNDSIEIPRDSKGCPKRLYMDGLYRNF